MNAFVTQCRVRTCSRCTGDTEYICGFCLCDLCSQCRENHVQDLKTIDHSVTLYSEQLNFIPKEETCWKHRQKLRKYCEHCQTPVCDSCAGHTCKSDIFHKLKNKHKMMKLQKAYRSKQKQHQNTIQIIRSGALFYTMFLLEGIKKDVQTCQAEFSIFYPQMLTKAKKLKSLIDNQLCEFDFKTRCLNNRKNINKYVYKIQRIEHRYEQSAGAIVQFLLYFKQSRFGMNDEEFIESLFRIQITGKGRRRVENERLLEIMPCPELHRSLSLTNVDHCNDISFVTSDLFWIKCGKNLVLTNTSGKILHLVKDVCIRSSRKVHTVTNEDELIYIDRNLDIKKLSKDLTFSTLLLRKNPIWTPNCICYSHSTGDLLVGMYRVDIEYRKIEFQLNRKKYNNKPSTVYKRKHTGIVARFNQIGQLKHEKIDENQLFHEPRYVTENNNGDIIVSDYHISTLCDLVVTDRDGKKRFSIPVMSCCVICVDALSNILVCEEKSRKVNMFDKDGHVLPWILVRPCGLISPNSLSYDINTHRLWVGSGSNKIYVYRYLIRKNVITGKFHHFFVTLMHM